MFNRSVPGLSFTAKSLLAISGGAVVAFLVATGMMNVSAIEAQTRSAPKPKFEAASIKRCIGPSIADGEGRGRGEPASSSDRLRIACWSLAPLIRTAYVGFAGGHFNGNQYPVDIVQLPAWANSELYTIEAKAEGSPGQDMMRGPMLQALLESRFALKIHAEMKDEPAYALTVTKGGFKPQPFEGGCTPLDPIHPPDSVVQPPCPRTNPRDFVMSLDIFSYFLANVKPRILDAPVINKTGIAGYFHFDMEPLLNLSAAPGVTPDDGLTESIFTAVQDFGLKLQATRAPRQYLVVDHVEGPSSN